MEPYEDRFTMSPNPIIQAVDRRLSPMPFFEALRLS